MIDRMQLPLALLVASNQQEIEGRTRMQKLVFLLQEEFDHDFPGTYQYIPYDYGPFAKKLYKDLDYLEKRGFIKEEKETMDDDKVKYRYKLTRTGKEKLVDQSDEEFQSVLELAESIKGDFNDLDLLKLLDYVYTKYPKYTEESVL